MNLLESLKKSPSPANYQQMIAYIGADKQRFFDLTSIYLGGPERITQRAATLLVFFTKKHPQQVISQLGIILGHFRKEDVTVAVKRNTLRFLQDLSIPKRWQGRVAELCFKYLTSHAEPIAVKVFAMTVLANLAIENKELKNELIPIIEDQMPFGSAGFRNRGARIFKRLS